MPIAHETQDNYGAYANWVIQGRPFRQSLQSAPDKMNFVDGLELFFKAQPDDYPVIYAMFDGILSFTPQTQVSTLTLAIDPTVLKEMSKFNMLEGRPNLIDYENIDQHFSGHVLKNLLGNAHISTTGNINTWHPSMRMEVKVAVGKPPITLKEYLDGVPNLQSEIEKLVGKFLKIPGLYASLDPGLPPPPPIAVELTQIPVRAGDAIGIVGSKGLSDPLPPTSPFELRDRLTLRVYDNCYPQVINPLYYLQQFIARAGSLANSLTYISPNHPLAALYPAILSGSPTIEGREKLNGKYYFPLGNLVNFQPPPSGALAGRYRPNDGQFEAQQFGDPAVISFTPTQADLDAVTSLDSNKINMIAKAFQVPGPLIIALRGIGTLTDPLGAESLCLEPLSDGDREFINQTGNQNLKLLEGKYDNLIATEGTLSNVIYNNNEAITFDINLSVAKNWLPNALVPPQVYVLNNGNRYQVLANSGVSDPAIFITAFKFTVSNRQARSLVGNTAEVLAGGFRTVFAEPIGGIMTLDELATLVSVTFGKNVSVGLIQTSILTARKTVQWIRSFGGNGPTFWINIGADSEPPPLDSFEPAIAKSFLFWMNTPAHALIVAAALLRLGYNTLDTYFFLPLVLEAYGAMDYYPFKIPSFSPSRGIKYYQEYMEPAARLLNAALTFATVWDVKFME
jgi:hypothetical protein